MLKDKTPTGLFMRYKLLFLSIVLLGSYFSSNAQLSISYSFGVIAGNKAGSFSGPITFDSKNACLTIKNGVTLYQAPALHRGVFVSNCNNYTNEKINFIITPNPINGIGKIYAEGINSLSKQFTVLILDAKGMKIKVIKREGISFTSGVELFMGDAAAGIYFANIYSDNFNQTIKFINAGF